VIFIIEDDRSVRRSFEIILESEGLEFRSFGSAESFLASEVPSAKDLLLLDINLPQMSGLDLLHKLDAENKPLNTIVITSVDDMRTRESCKRFGVKAFLRKPVDGIALMDLIRYQIPL
jgi:FixJ family two-component response regulator